MASAMTQTPPLGALIRSNAPVVTLSAKEFFPYHATLEAKIFALPLELRHQIYRYVLYTPDVAFQKTINGWRDCPDASDLTYKINNTALLAVSRRMRAEALPIMYGETKFRLQNAPMLRDFLNTATITDCMHLHIRKVSVVKWTNVLTGHRPPRSVDTEEANLMVAALADLPSLREVELSERHLPTNRADYESDEWFRLMDTLRSNSGYLRVVAALIQSEWWFDWRRVGGLNFGWCERILLRTNVDVHDWNALVEADLGNVQFDRVFELAMRENWTRGPLKHAAVEHEGSTYAVKIWGVPEAVRKREQRRAARKAAKQAYEEKRAAERSKASLVRLGTSDDEGSDEVVGMRSRKMVTREEARARRMEKQRG